MGNNRSSPTHEAPVRNYEIGVINYKVAVFGAGQSGKSSIIYWGLHKGQNLPPSNTFLAESFLQDYLVPFVCDGHQHELQLQDTSADESYSALQAQYIRESRAFIISFDITSRQSFDAVMVIRDNILRTKDSDRIPIVIVGTRYDKQAERVITLEDANNLAKICDAAYVEVDTTSGHGMEDVYSTTVRRVAQFNEPQHRPTPKK